MSSQSSSEIDEKSEPKDSAVTEFLRTHPNYFNEHLSLLSELKIPHDSGPAISLIERQVEVLRQKQRRYRQRIQELIHIARENDQISDKVHLLTLKIIECHGFHQVVRTVKASLLQDFGLDIVTIKIVGKYKGREHLVTALGNIFVEPSKVKTSVVQTALQYQEPVCGKLRSEQMDFLFGEHSSRVHSAALLPLGFGVMGLGSHDSKRFYSGMATHFLKHMGEIIARKMRAYIQPSF